MTVNEAHGCEECRRGVYGKGTQPVRIAVHEDGPTFLYHCEVCGTYWDYTLRAAVPISEERARERYPDAFAETHSSAQS